MKNPARLPLAACLLLVCLTGCTAPPTVTPPPVGTPPPLVIAPPVVTTPSVVTVLSPLQAIEQAAANPGGVSGLFAMPVRNTGTRTTGWETGYVFLNSEVDYRDQRCLTVAITADAVRAFNARGIDPAADFKNHSIRVSGTARRATIRFYSKGVKTELYYYQTQVEVTSPDQITLLP